MKTIQFTQMALTYSCILATLVACVGHETELEPMEKTPVAITASISGEVVTKANQNYQPTNGEKKIYMYYKDGSNSKSNEKGVYTYSSGWSADLSGTSIFWDDLDAVGGNYPFFAVSPKDLNNLTENSVEQDQSSANSFTNSDLLMAYTPNTAKKGNVPLTFKHMLAKLTVKVKVGAITNFSSSAVTIQNAKKEYTVTYGSPNSTTPATVAIKSEGGTFELTPHSEVDETYEGSKTIKVYSVILPAQDISSTAAKVKTTITVGSTSNSYTYAPTLPTSPVTLENGKHTTLTLTIDGTGVELNNIQVTDWTTATADGNISIDTP